LHGLARAGAERRAHAAAGDQDQSYNQDWEGKESPRGSSSLFAFGWEALLDCSRTIQASAPPQFSLTQTNWKWS